MRPGRRIGCRPPAQRQQMSDPTRSGPISVGDAVDVEARLRPDDPRTRAAIGALLGLERTMPVPVAPSLGPWKPNEPPHIPKSQPLSADAQGPLDTGTPPPVPLLASSAATARALGRVTFGVPSWASP